jgi:thioredoxin reductase (NADPH)
MVANNDLPGGQLMNTTDVENYPGFPAGVTGPELVAQLREQASRFGTEIIGQRIIKLDLSSRPFRLSSIEGDYEAESLIISTGAKPNMLPLEGIWDWSNRGLSTCATCDGFFYRGKDVAVVGGGDSALEEALFLTNHAESVTLIHRSSKLRASTIMQDRARANPKIIWRLNEEIIEITGQDNLSGLRLKNSESSTITNLAIDGLFVAIGHTPNTELFFDQIVLDDDGYIVTSRGQLTSVEGVFACGDVQDPVYRQAITSAGSGCRAALDAQRFLEEHILVVA